MNVIIVGGSAAGLSAALYLGRFRRDVLVIDGEKPANRFTHAAHGFFTRDGTPPAELIAIGRQQLQQYETVRLQKGNVQRIVRQNDQFTVTLADGSRYTAQKILLASGLKDTLPAVKGVEAFWGKSVFHCPYCDGWEQRDKPVAIYGNGEAAVHLAKLLRVLTADLVVCTDGRSTIEQPAADTFRKHGIQIIETPVECYEGQNGQIETIVFADGTRLARKAVFTRIQTAQHSDFVTQLDR